MQPRHPIPPDIEGRRTLEYWWPNGSQSQLTLPEVIRLHGFDGLRGVLLGATPWLANELPGIVKSLLYLATEDDRHLVLASGPLMQELEDAGVVIPREWVERLEALLIELDVELVDHNAEPMDDPDRAIDMRLKRLERGMVSSWRSHGLHVATASSSPASRIVARPRERRASRASRARAPADDGSSEPPPAIAGFSEGPS